MLELKIALTLAVAGFVTAYIAGRLNRPYPWNSPVLDAFEGIGVLVFLPAILTAIYQGIWLL